MKDLGAYKPQSKSFCSTALAKRTVSNRSTPSYRKCCIHDSCSRVQRWRRDELGNRLPVCFTYCNSSRLNRQVPSAHVCSARDRSDPWLVWFCCFACVFLTSICCRILESIEHSTLESSFKCTMPGPGLEQRRAIPGLRFMLSHDFNHSPLAHTPAHTGERCKRHTL